MTLNDSKIIGYVNNIEVKDYPDGARITHFDVEYPRVNKTDMLPCRLIYRTSKGTNNPRQFDGKVPVKEGDMIMVCGQLTTCGTNATRMVVDVHYWERLGEAT